MQSQSNQADPNAPNVFSNPSWTRIALVANLVGTVLLFWSFQATSSAFRLIRLDLGNSTFEYRICADEITISAVNTRGAIFMNMRPCPFSLDKRPVAIVTTEHQALVTVGFIFLLAGFFVQMLAAFPAWSGILRRRKKAAIPHG
jgi:hypothetical protein